MQPAGGEVVVLLAIKSICCQALMYEALGDCAWEVTSGQNACHVFVSHSDC